MAKTPKTAAPVAAPVSAAVAECIKSLRAAVADAGKAGALIAQFALTLIVVHSQDVEDVCDAMRDAALEAGHTSGAVYASQLRRIVKSGRAAEIHADLSAADAWVSFGSIISGYALEAATNRGAKKGSKKGANAAGNSGGEADGDPVNPAAPETVAALVPLVSAFKPRLVALTPDQEARDLLDRLVARLTFLAQSAKDAAKK